MSPSWYIEKESNEGGGAERNGSGTTWETREGRTKMDRAGREQSARERERVGDAEERRRRGERESRRIEKDQACGVLNRYTNNPTRDSA